jgi:WD40 repeat protein
MHSPLRRLSHNSEETTYASEVSTVSFTPDGRLIASGGTDGVIKIWNHEGILLSNYQLGQPITSFEFSPDSNRLAVATIPDILSNPLPQKGQIQIFEVRNTLEGKVELSLLSTADFTQGFHMGRVLSVAFNPTNSDELASGGEDGTVKLWDFQGNLKATFTGHLDAVTDVNFTPNGRLLASSSRDNTVKLWQIQQKALIHSLDRHERQVSKVAFNPVDPTELASAGFDNQVLIWKLPEALSEDVPFASPQLTTYTREGCFSAQFFLSSPEALNQNPDGFGDRSTRVIQEVKRFCQNYIELAR